MEVVNLSIKSNLILVENQIMKLQRLKEILDEAQQLLDKTEQTQQEINNLKEEVKPKIKARKVKIVKQGKEQGSKKFKFSSILMEFLSENSEKSYSYDELVKIMQKHIDKGYIEKPAKPLRDYISSLVHLYSKSKKIIVSNTDKGKSIQWLDDSENKFKRSNPKLSLLEETILEQLRSNPNVIYKPSSVSHRIRLGTDYLEIAETLSSDLSDAVDIAMKRLLGLGLLKEEDDGYILNEYSTN